MRHRLLALSLVAALAGCSSSHQEAAAPAEPKPAAPATAAQAEAAPPSTDADLASQRMGDYATVKLSADLAGFDDKQKRMLALLVQAADVTNSLYWQQSWGDKAALMQRIPDDATRRYAEINYGPWDRLHDDQPFVAGVGPRPPGVQFYPADMSKDEFEKADLKDKTGLYTLLRRDAQGKLVTVPFHEAYKADLEKAAGLLREAAELSADKDFASYLKLRADALLSDEYRKSDFAWMAMKKNPVDIVIGPIETYEDQLFGYKASYESYVLVKDQAWSEKLARFVKYLPALQRELPVDAKYKAEKPGSDADLNAYFAVYYAGDANVGAKTIAINLPNDEEVQLKKGTRRLQLENVMQAKFDR